MKYENIRKLERYINKIEKKEKLETQKDFMSRCIPKMIKEGKAQDQAIAICYNKWRTGDTEL